MICMCESTEKSLEERLSHCPPPTPHSSCCPSKDHRTYLPGCIMLPRGPPWSYAFSSPSWQSINFVGYLHGSLCQNDVIAEFFDILHACFPWPMPKRYLFPLYAIPIIHFSSLPKFLLSFSYQTIPMNVDKPKPFIKKSHTHRILLKILEE